MNKSLKNILQTIIPAEHAWKIELFKQWDDIIGPRMKNKVSIEKIVDDIMYLRVCHPAWAQEIMMLSSLLKEKINARLKEPKIATIRLHQRVVQKTAGAQKSSRSATPITVPPATLHQEELSMLAPLASSELQSSVAAYFVRCKSIQRSKDEKK